MTSQHDPQTNDNENHLIGNILAEDNSGKHIYPLNQLDSENEDNRSVGKSGFGGGFPLHSASPYMGAFNNVPDRVGSAPAVDLSVVILFLVLTFDFYSKNLGTLGWSHR